MRSARNFSPEWGYLAPTPSFARTTRLVLVATAIGATAGAGVVFALIDRPAEPEKTPLAARAIVTSVRTTAVPAAAPAASATPITAAVAVPVPASAPVVASAPPQEKPEAPRQANRRHDATNVAANSAATVFTGIAAAGAHAIH